MPFYFFFLEACFTEEFLMCQGLEILQFEKQWGGDSQFLSCRSQGSQESGWVWAQLVGTWLFGSQPHLFPFFLSLMVSREQEPRCPVPHIETNPKSFWNTLSQLFQGNSQPERYGAIIVNNEETTAKMVNSLQTFWEQKMRLNSLNKLIAMDYSLSFNLLPAEGSLCKWQSWSTAFM